MKRAALVAALALAIPDVADAAPLRGPQDTCSAEPSAKVFREAIAAAVARRDGAAIGALADPEIMLDFGGGAGREEFVTRLAGPDDQGSWADLAEVLALGCGFDGDLMVMPFVYMPEMENVYSSLLVLGKGVPLRAQPRRAGKIVTRLDWATVELVGDYREDRLFQRVRVVGMTATGWMETAKLRSDLDFRLHAERDATGRWRIVNFIAGD